MAKNIVLIGFMGTGKSSIGIRLAQKLHREFVDVDKEIERISGMSISELFRKYGEIRFRSEEKLMVKKLAARDNLVIATGGGLVLDTENIKTLSKNGIIICLHAEPEEILARVNRKKGIRPLLKKDFTADDIEKMLAERQEYYKWAELNVSTSQKGMDMVVKQIIDWLKEKYKLN